MPKLKWFYQFFVITLFTLVMGKSYALEEHEKLWLGVYTRRPLTSDQTYLYSLYSQFRFIDRSHPWQAGILEAALGLTLPANNTAWLGLRFLAQNPNNRFSQNYIFFQQILWQLLDNNNYRLHTRSRLEEFIDGHQSQFAFILRERASFEIKEKFYGMINPLVYDEVFLQLNRTNYTSHQFVSQNRLFLGFNWYVKSNDFWEMGYINQYEFPTPISTQNKMNHILAMTYNF